MKAAWIALALVIALFLGGCAKQHACEKPFIIVDGQCCTDADRNLVCDKDEGIEEPLSEPEVTGYTITTEKDSYAVGEEIKFVGEFESDLYGVTSVGTPILPLLYMKDGTEWIQIDYRKGRNSINCEDVKKEAEMIERYSPGESKYCGAYVKAGMPAPQCVKFNPKSVYTWDQQTAKFDNIDCEGPPEMFCFAGMEAAKPGVYKAEFSYTTVCTQDAETYALITGDMNTIETNEFTIA